MRVSGGQRQIVLPSHGGDPNVIVWNQFASVGKFRLHLAVPLAGALVGQKKDGGLEELTDQGQLRFPLPGPERTILEFAEGDQWQIDNRRRLQVRGDAGIVAEMRNNDVGVQQNATSRIHRSVRNLPR